MGNQVGGSNSSPPPAETENKASLAWTAPTPPQASPDFSGKDYKSIKAMEMPELNYADKKIVREWNDRMDFVFYATLASAGSTFIFGLWATKGAVVRSSLFALATSASVGVSTSYFASKKNKEITLKISDPTWRSKYFDYSNMRMTNQEGLAFRKAVTEVLRDHTVPGIPGNLPKPYSKVLDAQGLSLKPKVYSFQSYDDEDGAAQ